MSGALEIEWAGEKLVLLPERALWWAREKTLLIADPHFGKASTFRLAGLPVPETSHDDDLKRLATLVRRRRAERLVVLGDFLHAKRGRTEVTLMALKEWREKHPKLKIVLVIGNHDRHAGVPPAEWDIECVKEPWKLGPFRCCHIPPRNIGDGFALAGHLHPAFELYERSGLKARAVCFHFQEHLAVLPAFGNFTGTHTIEAMKGDGVFVVAGGQVADVSGAVR